MPSFDIINRINAQEVDNAVNNTLKELRNRYDFRGLHTEIVFDRKENLIQIVAADTMKMNALKEALISNFVKRGVSPKSLDFKRMEGTSQGHVKMSTRIIDGIDKEAAGSIVKEIKNLKLKVRPVIQQDQVRISGKKIDDLQSVIRHLKSKDFDLPLQFVNLK